MVSFRHSSAFTRRDLIVLIAVISVLALAFISALERTTQKSRSICCNCNLKQIGAAYRIWANDHGNFYPAGAMSTKGGWHDNLLRANASVYCWTNYAIMANELGQSPIILVCPADERESAGTLTNPFSNTNISYFVGVDASDDYPQSLLGGDRNLGPGTVPGAEYGFSPADGHGKDVTITGPLSWTIEMHSRGNSAGCGNILLGDGSVQQVTSASLCAQWLPNAWTKVASGGEIKTNSSTNSLAMRVIFP